MNKGHYKLLQLFFNTIVAVIVGLTLYLGYMRGFGL